MTTGARRMARSANVIAGISNKERGETMSPPDQKSCNACDLSKLGPCKTIRVNIKRGGVMHCELCDRRVADQSGFSPHPGLEVVEKKSDMTTSDAINTLIDAGWRWESLGVGKPVLTNAKTNERLCVCCGDWARIKDFSYQPSQHICNACRAMVSRRRQGYR